MAAVDAQRTVDELKELRALTGDENGAQRLAWTETWARSRAWLREKLSALPVEVTADAAGNIWATLRGASEKAVIIGGHLDSVPNGGWLDGSLNVLAGLEVLRALAAEGTPPVTVRLVDWADEEGARFGRSLFGSSACSGTLRPDDVRELKDRDGVRLVDAVAQHGVTLDRATDAHAEIASAAAYLELHIEQGPVLERMGLPLGVVVGTFGVERHGLRFIGQAAHAGSTPMNARRDAFAAAAKFGLSIRDIANRHGGVCTVGRVETWPGIITAVVGQCDVLFDQRHMNAEGLAAMLADAKADSERFAAEEGCTVEWRRIWQIEPIPFHPTLLDFCESAVREVSGTAHRLPSGPLHDAAEMARVGVPTVMMFTQSLRGISHNRIEDTEEDHLRMSVRAMELLARQTVAWVAGA
jgi:N-carbamoyl-L-amino-acid hydrolase